MKWIKTIAVCAMCMSLLSALPVSAAAGYKKNKLDIVSEPGKTNEKYVEYYEGEKQLTLDDLHWVEGRTGKGVRLDGDGDLLLVNAAQLNLPKCTFTMWIKWHGDEVDGKAADNQHFFTFYRGNTGLLTVLPDAVDQNGASLGNRLIFAREFNKKTDIDFRLQDEDGAPVAWEKDVWHHLALSFDGNHIYYYIDGELAFKELWVLNFAQLKYSYLLIGDNNQDHPSLNATIDDVALYDVSLSQEKIQRLMVGIDIHDDTTTTTTTTKPTTTATTTTTATQPVPNEEPSRDVRDWSSPRVWIPMAVAGGAIVLMLITFLTKKKT